MDSSIISVSQILNNAQIFFSAGFSAGYSFDGKKAADYFEELIENSISPSPIFSGILIMEKTGNDYTIVDGLQRLTTISLLLCALCENYKGTSEQNEDARSKIFSRFLVSQGEPKLRLEIEQQKIYKKILFSEELNESEKQNNLFLAYKSFLSAIKKRKIAGTELFRIISKIQFMTIITDKLEISVRDFYQVINSNKNESQIKLISNFIAQEDETSGALWQTIVGSFKKSEFLLESFIRDFLITRTDSETLNKSSLYNNFKKYYYTILKYQAPKTIIEGIFKYSKYYLKILNADFETPQIREQITILNKNGGKDSYPYLMEVLDDLENSHINADAFLNILMMINLFIKSRQEISVSNVNIDFSNLSKELNKMLVLKDYVPEILYENKLTLNEINNLSNFEV